MQFANRTIAGIQLAQELFTYKNRAVVYAIPRGGVPVATEIAASLIAPLDILITRKIGHPHQPEFAICAVTENRHVLCDQRVQPYIDSVWLTTAIEHEFQEIKRRRHMYGTKLEVKNLTTLTAIIVDDGVATGLTMKAAIEEIRSYQPLELIAAAPVMSQEAYQELQSVADRVVALYIPDYFGAVGLFYHYFPQLSDADVNKSLTPH